MERPQSRTRRVVAEPLLHFLVLGTLLFVGYGLLNSGSAPAPERIVISQGQLATMLEGFTRTWQRPPTRDEWDGLIRARVREEVYCREALALGMDKDDSVIRRRLQQKMEFISDDIAAATEPSDEQLNEFLALHPDTFRVAPKYTFSQVFLDPARHGDSLASDAAQLLARLDQAGDSADVSSLGDALMLEHDFVAQDASEIERTFGAAFAARLEGIAPGRWQGPIESGYGVHLVRVRERTPARQPTLAEVRAAVALEWSDARRSEANEQLYQAMLQNYAVTIEDLDPSLTPQTLAGTR